MNALIHLLTPAPNAPLEEPIVGNGALAVQSRLAPVTAAAGALNGLLIVVLLRLATSRCHEERRLPQVNAVFMTHDVICHDQGQHDKEDGNDLEDGRHGGAGERLQGHRRGCLPWLCLPTATPCHNTTKLNLNYFSFFLTLSSEVCPHCFERQL